MANDDNTRLALLEDKFNRLAEDIGMIHSRQDKTDAWIHGHEKEEITRHNEVINAINAVSIDVLEIKKKGSNRMASLDRLIVLLPTIIVVCYFLFWVYNQIKGTPVPVP